ncbi:MAG: hypothetical protein QT10_C0004G0046 [archaeon GW2011_AR19]|nr:MAG: hypothetical protein QT10_C0004G0046 [archaeon GW2011_AR19]
MHEKLGINIVIRTEKMNGKSVFIVNNEEVGVADFGDTLEDAIENFKKSLALYLEVYPEKKDLFIKEETQTPLMVSRILI